MSKLRGQLFARLALDYFDHPKIMSLSAEAIVAHLEMIVYSRKYGTDGAIPMRFAMRFANHVLDELASNDPEKPSIIKNDDGTVSIYGYEDMQETSAQIEARRQVRKEAGRAGATARWEKDDKSHGKPHSKSHGKRMAETETETETERTSDSSAEEIRPDMAEILDHLDHELEANNLKKPNRVQSNIRAARLLLDRDGHTVDEVKSIISFAQSSEFWMPNIRSMSKLREKYDTLQAQASRPGPKADPRVAVANDPWTREGPF